MSTTLPLQMQALDAPLPAEVTGSGHGWFTRYRTYPVFSPAWGRGRAQVWLALAVSALVLTTLPLLDRPLNEMPLGGLAQMAVQALAPIALGPWAAGWVRRRHWSPRREWWSLVLVMVALVVALLAFHRWGAEPMKQWLAEQVGAVDETGQRRRIVMAVGVSVMSPPPGQPVGDPTKTEVQDSPQLMNTLSSAALTLWLGGGLGLWGWRRERASLAALAQTRELAQAQAQRREAELRLSVLAAQVEPHFLFNTLAGVRSAIATDPGRASDMIDRLVDYLRAAIPRLRSDGAAAATLGAQLDIVRSYLGLMHARMPRLSFHIDAPPELLEAPCPPLMLISLAENAVKHGAEPKVGPVHIDVMACRTEQGQLAVTVSDDGAGFDAQASAGGTGLGLSNIRERLRQMHGERASLALRARAEGGVAATLTVPLE
jgi:signal transduction histidine kinase